MRDHGFLHGNAKKTLKAIQTLLGPMKANVPLKERKLECPDCRTDRIVALVLPKRIPIQFRFYPLEKDQFIGAEVPT